MGCTDYRPDVPLLYDKVQRELQSYFRNVESIEKRANMKGQLHFVQKLNGLIETNLDQDSLCVDHLCHGMALSHTQLYRKMRIFTNLPPAKYIQFYRLQKAKEILQNTDMNVSEVAFRVGFLSHSHFTRAFHKQFGFKPSSVRK